MKTMIGTDEIKRVNRLELLMFSLGTSQIFGINVLKVKELMSCPKLTQLPTPHPSVKGVVQLRGNTLSVIDLAAAIGIQPADEGEQKLIITEFNRSAHGLLVHSIDRITLLDWSDISPPSAGLGDGAYITGITKVDNRLVQVLDVERILGDIGVISDGRADELTEGRTLQSSAPILVVDDSNVALKRTVRMLKQLGLEHLTATDGKEALEILTSLAEAQVPIQDKVAMVISDIEMPEMDGYTLTREIRDNPKLSSLYVLLHSSLNGTMNDELASRVGANASLTKFIPDLLADEIERGLQ